jgi:uncharacterized protein YkwD
MPRNFTACCAAFGVLLAIVPAAEATPAERMLEALNRTRAAHGLELLRPAPRLAAGAIEHSRWVLAHQRLTHPARLDVAGFSCEGEAMAVTRGGAVRPRAAVRMWLRSAVHRLLLLDKRFRYTGVGWERGRFGGRRSAIWVVRFAAP